MKLVVVAKPPTGRTKYTATWCPNSCNHAAVDADADRPSSGSNIVTNGRTVQSMTHRSEAMFDILSSLSNATFFVLFSSSNENTSVFDENKED